MWRMNSVPNTDVCPSINTKAYQALITSSQQQHHDPVNHPLIHMMCPEMMKNT
jgi:hypothetical protein